MKNYFFCLREKPLECQMENSTVKFPTEKAKRIVMFCDLRDSTDILMDFEHGIYCLENIYRFTKRMRTYNDSQNASVFKPRIDIGFGITVGGVSFVYYPLDKRHHPVGRCIHEAARIEGLSRLYDARILISDRFFKFAEGYIYTDQRFSYRFIDRIILKGFREPITLFELFIDNDPGFGIKKNSMKEYSEAYSRYCRREWGTASELFQKIYQKYGLGIGSVMAKRCNILSKSPSNTDWNGI